VSTQRDRMLRGELYDTRDAELLALAHRARALIASFSAAPSTDLAARRSILELVRVATRRPRAFVEPSPLAKATATAQG